MRPGPAEAQVWQDAGRGAGFGEESARQLAEVENRDVLLAELREGEGQRAAAYVAAAELLRAAGARRRRLDRAAERQINELAMRVRFAIEVSPERDRAGWTAHGWDEIAYRIATNAGEPLKPLEEIASGGEMSRVMLALKVTVEEAVSPAWQAEDSSAAHAGV